MTCQTNPWLNYNQCTGVTPQWFIANDGCNNLYGCLPLAQPCPTIHRRFSPYCKMIDVTPSAPQVYLRVAPSPQSDSLALTFTQSRVQLQLRRKGCEDVIATYNAWRRDENGYIGFYFDDALFSGCSGFYIGDVFIDCQYCFSVNLRLPPCESFVTDCYVQPILETCAQGMCGVLVPAGFGVVGGLYCSPAQPESCCGTIAPFFPLTNPPPPAPVCSTGSTCCYVPATAAGAAAAG